MDRGTSRRAGSNRCSIRIDRRIGCGESWRRFPASVWPRPTRSCFLRSNGRRIPSTGRRSGCSFATAGLITSALYDEARELLVDHATRARRRSGRRGCDGAVRPGAGDASSSAGGIAARRHRGATSARSKAFCPREARAKPMDKPRRSPARSRSSLDRRLSARRPDARADVRSHPAQETRLLRQGAGGAGRPLRRADAIRAVPFIQKYDQAAPAAVGGV